MSDRFLHQFCLDEDGPVTEVWTLAAFMHRGLIMGAFRRMVGFFEKPAQREPPRRFSAAEVL